MRILATIVADANFEGIKIVGTSLEPEANLKFAAAMVAALELIKSVDPRRFRRIQKEVVYILHRKGLPFASYHRGWKSCQIDGSYFGDADDPNMSEWAKWAFATSLVHEATHGAIYTRHIGYTAALRMRIEYLCRTEQRRFAQKADSADRRWSDALAPPLDEGSLHEYWNNTFARRLRRWMTGLLRN